MPDLEDVLLVRLLYAGVMGVGSVRKSTPAPMRSPVNWALLGLIIERPSYAYELAQRFERLYDGALTLSTVSHAYVALRGLGERGYVLQQPADSTSGKSRRRYEATPEGIAAHAQWLVGQVAEERRRQRLLIVQLGALVGAPGRAVEILDAYERACLGEATAAPAAKPRLPGAIGLVTRLSEEERRLTIAARLRWVQYARMQVSDLDTPASDLDTPAAGERPLP